MLHEDATVVFSGGVSVPPSGLIINLEGTHLRINIIPVCILVLYIHKPIVGYAFKPMTLSQEQVSV